MQKEYRFGVGSHGRENWIAFLAIAVGVFATWIAVFYARQPLLELQAFRQTQTALTSYWMIQEGWQLPYQTPVLGYPWAVPFEFPIYQAIVALISWAGDFPLDPVGRLVSFCFLLACAWPAFAIARRLALPVDVAWAFCALLWSSPLYLFYGRNFLIETTAVFFSLAAVPYALDLLDPYPRWRSALLFAFLATLGMLQKITTALPVVLVMAAVLAATSIKDGLRLPSRKLACLIVALAVPLIFGGWWTSYAGSVRAHNYYGQITTFAAQHEYYLGRFMDRFDVHALVVIFWNRIMEQNAAGFLGVALITGAVLGSEPYIRNILLVSLALFALPVLVFFKVHYFVDYYQTECVLFLLGALAISCVVWLPKLGGQLTAMGVLAILVLSNLFHFYTGYGRYLNKKLDVLNSRTLAVSDVVRRYTSPDSGILVFGLTTYESAWPVTSWSSEIVYYSQRKGFTVEDTFEDRVWNDPASFLGGKSLGAIVVCSKDIDKYMPIIRQYDKNPVPAIFKVDACYVWLQNIQSISLPEKPPTSVAD